MITGLAHGCFDIFHFGHLNHLESARRLCDKLIVCITPDAYVNKGPKRPVFPAVQRARLVAALRCVDEVFIGEGPDVAINALTKIKPTRFFKGQEYEIGNHPAFERERKFCGAMGIEVWFTHEDVFSSTLALQRLKEAAA